MPLSDAAGLFAAIDAGDDDGVAATLAAAPGVAAACDVDGVSATMHALYRGRAAIAERVAAALPELNVFEAAALGRIDRLREILERDPDAARARSADGFGALHFPGFFGLGAATEAASALIAAGADVNARSDNAMSVLPLHSAVAGNHDDIVAVLLAAGADPNATQRHDYTPLHGAAESGAAATVERLLAAGADLTATTADGRTAADLAAAGGHESLVARLR